MTKKVDPEEIKKLMPETWEEKEKFTTEIEKLAKGVIDCKDLMLLPGIHPVMKAFLRFQKEFNYIKGDDKELEYFKNQILPEIEVSKNKGLEQLKKDKFNKLYMAEVEKLAKKDNDKKEA